MRVVSCVLTQHNLWLVALAAIVCVSGSAITFSLYARARERAAPQKYGWQFLTAVAAGSSIWCTHFIAMLAYEVSAPVTFDPILTMASLIVAIVGCGTGFGISAIDEKRFSPWLCGIVVGLSVALMHYTGMAAYRVSGLVEWAPAYVFASVAIAAAVSGLALRQAVRGQHARALHSAIALFVLAIVGLHFTAMTAVQVTPTADDGEIGSSEVFTAIAVAVAGVGLLVVGTGVASYLIDERTIDTLRQVQRIAHTDTLTGLPNRMHFSGHLERELEQAGTEAGTIAVLGIDLNRFKEINDLSGHEAGDQALRLMGGRLAALLRPGEFIARVGGDEFAAIKRYHGVEDLNDFLARLEKALCDPVHLDGFAAVTGGSIGVALFPQDAQQAAALVSNADLAMYRAKAQPGRTTCFYEKQMDEAVRERKALRADLGRAIEMGELELHYQVQKVVWTSQISGYEALLRWRHRERGMISPAQFIPIAEETGAIVPIGDWVLRTACRAALAWREPHKIAVNVSPVQLAQCDLAEQVRSVLAETGLPPARLELEITETAIIADKDRALSTLRRIRALGVSIAIDDFGAGYSSFDTLRTFPFSKIKLDRSFTQDIDRDARAKAMVRAVLSLAKGLEIPVIAEGVETQEQLLALRNEGCDEAQGYFLGRPGPLSANIHGSVQECAADPPALAIAS